MQLWVVAWRLPQSWRADDIPLRSPGLLKHRIVTVHAFQSTERGKGCLAFSIFYSLPFCKTDLFFKIIFILSFKKTIDSSHPSGNDL